MKVFGIDIGGTKTTLAVGSLEGEIFAKRRFLSNPNRSFLDYMSELKREASCLLDSLSISDIELVGIAAPGPLSVKRGMLLNPPNLPQWQDAHLVKEVEDVFGCPVGLNNDGNASCLAEYYFGKYGTGAGMQSMLYLTMSTGIGGGAVEKGKLIQGASDTALEVGYMVIDLKGPDASSEKVGYFEEFCGGKALAARVEKQLKEEKITSSLSQWIQKGEPLKMEHIIEAVRAKDTFAAHVWEEFLDRAAQGVSILIMTLNPEVVLLGTIAIHAEDLFIPPLKERLKRFTWPEPLKNLILEAGTLKEDLSPLSGIAVAKAFNLEKG
jgi:glucokinase